MEPGVGQWSADSLVEQHDTKNHAPGDRWKLNGPGVLCVLAAWRELKNLVMTENAIAKEIVDAAFRIHTTLGPGLLESVENLAPLDKKQLLTYVRLADKRLGCSSTFTCHSLKTASRASSTASKTILTQSPQAAKTPR
jgi:hypothetical protein